MRDEYEHLRMALTVRRSSLGLTQQEVAEAMGRRTASYVSALESGYPRRPSTQVWLAWARAVRCDLHFDVTLTYLTPIQGRPRMYDVTPDLPSQESQ